MTKVDIEPLEDRLLVEPVEPDAVSPGGIVIPDSARRPGATRLGRVLAVGPGRMKDGERVPMAVRVGDEVAYERFVGHEYKIGQQEFRILSEGDVLAKVER